MCEQFATPLLLLEFSPGDLGAPSIFGLSVLLFKVRRRRPLHAYTRPSLSSAPPLPSSTAPQHLPSYTRSSTHMLDPSTHAHSGPPHTAAAATPRQPPSRAPPWQFVFGPMCGSWMDRAARPLVIQWGIGLQCAGVALALCVLGLLVASRPQGPSLIILPLALALALTLTLTPNP